MPRRSAGLVAALVLVAACAESPTQPLDSGPDFSSSGGPVIGTVTGSGHAPCTVVGFVCAAVGELRTFSFSAVAYADGSASGRAQMNNRQHDIQMKLAIVCISFRTDNRAWILGRVTQVSGGNAVVGQELAFAVQDNGEGSADSPDKITGALPLLIPGVREAICDNASNFASFLFNVLWPATTWNTVHGNIQVRAPES